MTFVGLISRLIWVASDGVDWCGKVDGDGVILGWFLHRITAGWVDVGVIFMARYIQLVNICL